MLLIETDSISIIHLGTYHMDDASIVCDLPPTLHTILNAGSQLSA